MKAWAIVPQGIPRGAQAGIVFTLAARYGCHHLPLDRAGREFTLGSQDGTVGDVTAVRGSRRVRDPVLKQAAQESPSLTDVDTAPDTADVGVGLRTGNLGS